MKRLYILLCTFSVGIFALPYTSVESVWGCVMTDIVAKWSNWKYLDTGANLGTSDIVVGQPSYTNANWKHPSYDDSTWMSGPAQLGYGETEATTVSYGPSSTNKYVTTYFRHTFTVTDPSLYQNLYLSLWRDDGAIVYLNGHEVLRSNMVSGSLGYTTFAFSAMSGNFEYQAVGTNIDTSLLVAGDNILAVEVHQADLASSDVIFNLQLRNISCGSLCTDPDTRMVAIGDMWVDSQGLLLSENERSIARLTDNLNPDFVITMGDNNYTTWSAATIDRNVGKYYQQYIGNYVWSYGTGSTVNRFFPALWNHDWWNVAPPSGNISAYLNYFTLLNNERYYNFSSDSIEFITIDSDANEPDGVLGINAVTLEPASIQSAWLKNTLQSSDKQWKLLYFHHPPFSTSHYGNAVYMQWPFTPWWATLVMNGHEHGYERLKYDGLDYVINGGGGAQLRTDRVVSNSGEIATSEYYESKQHTLVYIESSPTCFHMQTIAVTGEVIDSILQEVIPDTVSPSVTVNQALDNPDPDPDSIVKFDIVFSEPVIGFSADDLLMSGSTTASVVAIIGLSDTYQVVIGNIQDGETISLSVPAGSVLDAANNPNTASTSTDNSVAVIYQRPGQCGGSVGEGYVNFSDISPACDIGILDLTNSDTNATDGIYNWTCLGVNGWEATACTAPKKIPNQACINLPNNAHWNGASSIDQIFDGSTYVPDLVGTWNLISSLSECVFVCDNGYSWDGGQCTPIPSVCGTSAWWIYQSSLEILDPCDIGTIDSWGLNYDMQWNDGIYNWTCTNGVTNVDCEAYKSRIMLCTDLPTHAHWNTVYQIEQVFDGNIFVPTTAWSYNLTPATELCHFVCDSWYTWDNTVCVQDMWWVCGSDNGLTLSQTPTNLCQNGTASVLTEMSDRWEWTCLWGGWGADVNCSADRAICGDGIAEGDEQCDDGNSDNFDGCSSSCELENPVNGQCGPSDGIFTISIPISGLCNSGVPTTVTGSWPWSWSCLGYSQWSDDTCATVTVVYGAGGGSYTNTQIPQASPPPQQFTPYNPYNTPSWEVISYALEANNQEDIPEENIEFNSAPEITSPEQCIAWDTIDQCQNRNDCVNIFSHHRSTVARAQALQWIWERAWEPMASGEIANDISKNLETAYLFAQERSIVKNKPLFYPERSISRFEAYTMLFRAFCIDIDRTYSSDFVVAVHHTAVLHWATNRSFEDFAPHRSIREDEFWTIFFRLLFGS